MYECKRCTRELVQPNDSVLASDGRLGDQFVHFVLRYTGTTRACADAERMLGREVDGGLDFGEYVHARG